MVSHRAHARMAGNQSARPFSSTPQPPAYKNPSRTPSLPLFSDRRSKLAIAARQSAAPVP